MKLYGIFIGVNQYLDKKIPNLQFACKDAFDLYEGFRNSLHPEDCDIRLFIDSQATKDAIMNAVEKDLAGVVTQEDIVIIYFSGHGATEYNNVDDNISSYLILHDTKQSEIFTTGIDMQDTLLTLWFNSLRAKLILLIVDSCFSGMIGGKTFKGPQLMQLGLRSAGIRLSQLNLGKGQLILTASAEDELAFERSELQHGLFTYHLLETLKVEDRSEKTISVAELYEQVAKKVYEESKCRQLPMLIGKSKLARIPLLKV